MKLVLRQVQVSLGPVWPEVAFLSPPGCDVKQLCAMPPQPRRKGRIPPTVPPPQRGEVARSLPEGRQQTASEGQQGGDAPQDRGE